MNATQNDIVFVIVVVAIQNRYTEFAGVDTAHCYFVKRCETVDDVDDSNAGDLGGHLSLYAIKIPQISQATDLSTQLQGTR